MAIRGYTEEVEETYNAALALLKEARELPQCFQVLRSLASLYLYRGEFDKAAAVGREPLELAEEQDDTGLQVEGHLVLGTNIANIGDIKTGLHHLDRAIALYDRHRHGSGRFRLGPNPGVVSYTTSAFLLWLLGYPDQAVERASSGEELARQLNHPFTLAYALFHAGILDVWRRELKRVHQRASDALVIAEDHDYQVWESGRPRSPGRGDDELRSARRRSCSDYSGHGPLPEVEDAAGLLAGSAFSPSKSASLRRPAGRRARRDRRGNRDDPRRKSTESRVGLLKGDLLLAVSDADAAGSWFQNAFDVPTGGEPACPCSKPPRD
jgi:tetratricopeptide (TPR) repeat protein